MNLEYAYNGEGKWSLMSNFNMVQISIAVTSRGKFEIQIPNTEVAKIAFKSGESYILETFDEAYDKGIEIYKDIIKREYETHFTTVIKMGEKIE